MDERIAPLHGETKDKIQNEKEQLRIQNIKIEEKIKEHKELFNQKIKIIDKNIMTIEERMGFIK